MDRTNLVEIKKGQTGTGILIENDGYITMHEGKNRELFESYKKLNEDVSGGDFHCPYPFIVDAVFQKFDIENANGRIYPESVLKREVMKYQKKIEQNWAYGELNHPSESVIDLGRVAMNIKELHWEGHTLVGKLEIITSEGFRKHGICSTMGDQAANLLLNGLRIGVSSRGLGTVTQRMGVLYVSDDYEIVCWDIVSDPSTNNAFIEMSRDKIEPYIEGKTPTKAVLDERVEKLNRFDDWLKS